MKPRTTRTLNRLPFHDLEPHRFEDLVRGLAHSFREWRSLEDTGRAGDDDGIDIRGTEAAPVTEAGADEPAPDATEFENASDAAQVPETGGFVRDEGRTWIFQCKREKRFSASDVDAIIAATGDGAPPYGFIVAVAADVTKKTRDHFRRQMASWGVSEFQIWARGELEDLLFQPRHDHLLFAFFGISLQAKKRGIEADLRASVAVKRQLTRLFKSSADSPDRLVVIRHIEDRTYPKVDKKRSRWRLFRYVHVKDPRGPMFETGEYLAWVSPDGKSWDVIPDHNISSRIQHRFLPHDAWVRRERDRIDEPETPADQFWTEAVYDGDKAELHVARVLAFENIVAIDPFGDGFYPVPQLFVTRWNPERGPFEDGEARWLRRRSGYDAFGPHLQLDLWEPGSMVFFPDKIDENALADFDITATAGTLRSDSEERLAKACAPPPEPVSDVAGGPARSPIDVALGQFDAWRKATALPCMSAVVRKLRGAGYTARVAARVPARLTSDDPQRSVELRFSKEVVAPAGHTYVRDGYFRVEHAWGDKSRVSVSPMRRDTSGTSRAREEYSLAEMTAEWLENELVSMVERFGRGEY